MDWDLYQELRKEGQAEGETRRAAAESMFEKAKVRAFGAGLMLRRNTEAHYTLGAGPAGDFLWLWDLYPGKGRIRISRVHPATPRLEMSPAWSLLDVVEAAIKAKGQRPPARAKGATSR
jgi:hypothetical protein